MGKSLFSWLLLLLVSAGLLQPGKAQATGAAAGELMYKWVSGSTYDLLVRYYHSCGGGPEPTTFTVCYTNTCDSFQGTLTLNKISGNLPQTVCGHGGLPLPDSCSNSISTCQNPNATLPGYKEFWYYARVTLPSQCDFWRFSTAAPNRNPAITNLANPGASAMYLESTLYSAAGTGENPGNSSPCFLIKPILYINNGIPISHFPGAIDADGDSLTYELIMPRDQDSGCNGVDMAFSQPQFQLLNNPFATGNTFSLNSATGHMTFISSMLQVANIAMLVKEYQNGVLRGTTVREMQIVTLPGSGAPPQPGLPTTITGGQAFNGRIEGYAGQLLQFCFPVLASDTTARLEGRDNHNSPPPGISPVAPGASLAYNNIYTDSLNVCLSWTPTLSDTGLHSIIITILDTVCHPPGLPRQTTFALPIYIYPPTAVIKDNAPENLIYLFPNPAAEFVRILNTAAQPLKAIRILDITGALIQETVVTNGKEQRLDISRLVSGIYLLRIEMAGGAVAVRRLQVKR